MVALRAIVDAGHDVAVVVSRADKRRGRQSRPGRARSRQAALELGLTVSTRPEDAAEVGAELGVVVAFGRIIKKDVLDRLPLVNAHFSLLPRWRGAAPVERAILAGDAMTGVCLMAIDEGLDTGPVYALRAGRHRRRRDGGRAAGPPGRAGAPAMLVEPWPAAWARRPVPQEGTPTYADKIEPPTCGWTGPPTPSSCTGWCGWGGPGRPGGAAGCWCWPGRGRPGPPATDRPAASRATWWRPAPEGLRLLTVQPEGRAPMAAADWVRGARPQPGELLGP